MISYYNITEEELASVYETNECNLDLYLNQFVIFGDKKFRYTKNGLQEVKTKSIKGNYIDKTQSKNFEQDLALDILMDDSVQCVALIGQAGTGKTYLAVQVGLYKLDKNKYEKLFFVRNNIEITKPLGALPGEKFDKIKPYMSSFVDNLDGWEMFSFLIDKNLIEVEALGFMQGRSLKNCYIICDEAQNLTKDQVKMLVTRVGEGSKIVFTGDIDQILSKEFMGENNGLIHLIDKFKGQELFGAVELVKTERSELAELACQLL